MVDGVRRRDYERLAIPAHGRSRELVSHFLVSMAGTSSWIEGKSGCPIMGQRHGCPGGVFERQDIWSSTMNGRCFGVVVKIFRCVSKISLVRRSVASTDLPLIEGYSLPGIGSWKPAQAEGRTKARLFHRLKLLIVNSTMYMKLVVRPPCRLLLP